MFIFLSPLCYVQLHCTTGKDTHADTIGTSRKRRMKKRRLRSRNSVIDEWLEQEDGADAYADLEDFLVI